MGFEPSRGTKCFASFHGKDVYGAFPKGFITWLRSNGWLSGKTIHLCSGSLEADENNFTVDVRPEMNPSLCGDATDTKLDPETFDSALIDPPYSRELANKLYKTADDCYSINSFIKEGLRLVKPGGLVTTLSYEIPKRHEDSEMIAIWGVYTVPMTSQMRALVVFRKTEIHPDLFDV